MCNAAGQLAPFAQCGGKGGHCKTAGTCVDATWSKVRLHTLLDDITE